MIENYDNPSLIDTNILVYAFDNKDLIKKRRCERLLKEIIGKKFKFYLSTQILSEFYVVTTGKTAKILEKEEAKQIVEEISEIFNILEIKKEAIIEAIRISVFHKTSFWDALIAATMLENNIFTIYTENEKDFSKITELKIINPLK